ncbi:hypothetical protein PsYK624_163800 [Phanerochaete sordida]|uniref:Uncharacterized protein n=1 Tax=Phanerochaete sordida TaxID=48140 RepID=A0A9P3GQU1_9APHY|nr:hypothetical protein PsYK624_163800 [Phanerochaete sordida]
MSQPRDSPRVSWFCPRSPKSRAGITRSPCRASAERAGGDGRSPRQGLAAQPDPPSRGEDRRCPFVDKHEGSLARRGLFGAHAAPFRTSGQQHAAGVARIVVIGGSLALAVRRTRRGPWLAARPPSQPVRVPLTFPPKDRQQLAGRGQQPTGCAARNASVNDDDGPPSSPICVVPRPRAELVTEARRQPSWLSWSLQESETAMVREGRGSKANPDLRWCIVWPAHRLRTRAVGASRTDVRPFLSSCVGVGRLRGHLQVGREPLLFASSSWRRFVVALPLR